MASAIEVPSLVRRSERNILLIRLLFCFFPVFCLFVFFILLSLLFCAGSWSDNRVQAAVRCSGLERCFAVLFSVDVDKTFFFVFVFLFCFVYLASIVFARRVCRSKGSSCHRNGPRHHHTRFCLQGLKFFFAFFFSPRFFFHFFFLFFLGRCDCCCGLSSDDGKLHWISACEEGD